MKESAIDINNLSVTLSGNLILDNISVSVEKGMLTGLIGPNGAGKSTLLKAILGLIPVNQGTITFFGKPLNEIRKEIAFVPQRQEIDWDFPATVEEIVLMGRFPFTGFFKRYSSEDKFEVKQALASAGITNLKNRQIGKLSGGQQQRVFIARALAQQASLIILDEPFAGIDAATEETIREVFIQLKNIGKTVLIVHHDLQTAAEYFDRLILLNVKIIEEGKKEDVLKEENLVSAYGRKVKLY
jgi:ABC-type Mn2+/Zn2+ transport system ATPase subunit